MSHRSLAASGPRVQLVRRVSVLGGFVDGVMQKLENCRAGLPESLEPDAVARYVAELYANERPRLHEAVQAMAPLVAPEALDKEESELDDLFRRVLLPAYVRAATSMTRSERNDFYLAKPGFHGLERVGWLGGGVLAGFLVVWAPFIPVWSQDIVLPFAAAGLFFPELRRYFAFRRYAKQVNTLVSQVEAECQRVQAHYLDAPAVMERLESPEHRPLPTGQKEGS
jgi:hypothetical protein